MDESSTLSEEELDDVEEQEEEETPSIKHHKWLVYGPAGDGKTQLISDAPSTIWFDFEDSTDTIVSIGKQDKVNIQKIKSYNKFSSAIARLPGGHETIVVDTISSLLDMLLVERMDWVEKNTKRSRFETAQQDYKYVTHQMRDLLYRIVKLDVNVIIIAHEREFYDEEGTLIGIRPDLSPRVADIFRRRLSGLFYYRKEGTATSPIRKLYVTNHGRIQAKNRYGLTESVIQNPTWDSLMKVMKIKNV